MDRGNFAQKLKDWTGNKKIVAITGTVIVGVVALTVGLTVAIKAHSLPKDEKLAAAKALYHDMSFKQWVSKISRAYGGFFVTLQDKVDEIRRLGEENEHLRLENQHLRLAIESQRYDNYASKAEKITQAYEMKLSKETGNRIGRTLASIPYHVPTDLVPAQLYQLGMMYFNSREDERAAVILSFLTGLEDDNTFKTQQNYMITGIAWYRLDNYELANFYFNQVNGKLLAQAKLWKALVAEKHGQHAIAQQQLHEIMDQNPRSLEARWVNPLADGYAASASESENTENGTQGNKREPANEH